MTFWRRHLKDRISYKPVTGKTAHGDRTYGAQVNAVPARVERVSYELALNGEEVLITHQISTEAQLKQGDLVTLPGEASARIVRRAESASQLRGNGTLFLVEVS